MTLKRIFAVIACMGVCSGVVATDAMAAAKKKTSTQSAITKGTSVRTKVEAKGIYDQECYDMYYGCMDQFCITDNSNGGSCACSDDSIEFEKRWNAVLEMTEEAERVRTEEVEKVKAGADADIIFGAEREYDEDGNIVDVDDKIAKDKKAQERADLLAMFEDDFEEDEDIFEDSDTDMQDAVGAALYRSANEICMQQVPDKCEKDMAFLKQVYSRQITSDCKGFENTVKAKESEAKKLLASAESEVRAALKESFESANKYDRGQCMVEYKKCMMTEDACGKDWASCVFTIASENMQNNETKSTAGTKVETVNTYDITESTMKILESKRYICEHVLDECVNVRDMVWNDFLREAAPTIRVAETKVESQFRQSCLGTISTCIQNACKDDIEGKGVATMDACLARPDMARSFCKVEIDPCERMEPMIWDYVVDKLAAMRVDACTAEVKECFTAEDRCGANFQNCIGMDYDYIHDICPIDSLVVCKQGRSDFSMDDLDSMLMGLYLNIDNSAMEQCQNLVDAKMAEICGSTTDCNRFAADDTIGTGSLRAQKDGTIYRLTGMISFGSIKMGMASTKVTDDEDELRPGQIGVQEYIAKVVEKNSKEKDSENIIAIIEEELNNIAGTINRTIEMIEQDPEIQYCISGRDLSQITGKSGDKTSARFPNLLNQVKMQIAVSALRQAQDNYNKKFNEEVTKAMKDASVDVAQYMCQMLPHNGGVSLGSGATSTAQARLTQPYAISYEIASGVDTAQLASVAAHSQTNFDGGSLDNTAGSSKTANVVSQILSLGMSASNNVKVDMPGGMREMWSVFNRETRNCHYCTSTVTKSCKTENKKGFLGIGSKNNMECTESEPVEKCQDIPM